MEANVRTAERSSTKSESELTILPTVKMENPKSPSKNELWEDVTLTFQNARQQMGVGEMVHHRSFSLHAAMSAIELMDPKMDVGFGESVNVLDVVLPTELSDAQVITIMDQLLVCLMSWLDGHNLLQTVFACVYSQRMREVPRFELFAFLHVLFAIMDAIINLVLDEKVADEEDFMASTYGFSLQPLSSDTNEDDEMVLERILNAVDDSARSAEGCRKNTASAIATRVRFLVEFYRTMQCLSGFSSEHSQKDSIPLLASLQKLAGEWIAFTQTHQQDTKLLSIVFDPSINRHLMTSSPPPTAPLFSFESASEYLKRILHELTEAVHLEEVMLPMQTSAKSSQMPSARYSLHVALHAISCFSAKLNPSILTRSVLSRIMLPAYSSALFGRDDTEMKRLFATDIGFSNDPSHYAKMAPLAAVSEGTSNTFKCFCHNVSRQRRLLLRISRWWDHFVSLTTPAQKISHIAAEDEDTQGEQAASSPAVGSKSVTKDTLRRQPAAKGYDRAVGSLFSDMTPIQIVAYEVTSRLMIQHWLLGFECELYQDYEYGTVFFYVAYALSSLANATTSLGESGEQGLSLHPLRFAVYQMDEARLWMCRAMHSALLAFSNGSTWSYSCHRKDIPKRGVVDMFGSEELWYEQRFGVAAALVNGPAHADYASFVSFKENHEKSLLAHAEVSDNVQLLLQDAVKGFLMARRNLETAKAFAVMCSSNFVLEEILQIARVAVENSLTLSEVLRKYVSEKIEQVKPLPTKQNVSFSFTRHRHFPVIKLTSEGPHR